MKLRLLAGTSPFAHLIGLGTNDKQQPGESDEHFRKRYERDTAEKPVENNPTNPEVLTSAEDDDKKREGESDEDFNKRKEASARAKQAEEEDKRRDGESDEDYEDRKKKNAERRAAEDKERERAQAAEDKPDKEDDDKNDKSARRPDEDPGDDRSDERELRGEHAAARRHERARCAAIFDDPAAAKNVALAATLAFMTDLPRSQAIAVLRAGGTQAAPKRPTLDERMAAARTNPPANPPQNQSAANEDGLPVADRIVIAGMRRRGEEDQIPGYLKERAAALA